MLRIVFGTTILSVLLVTPVAPAQDAPPQSNASNNMPILRLEAGGPTSFVSALAFNPSGTTLYAGGWDKVVRSWSWDVVLGKFILDPVATFRVPIGPAMEGVLNAVAVSPDGMWLATAGRGMINGASDLQHSGWKIPVTGTMTSEMHLDQGTIHLFNTRTREVRMLRGHTAPVVSLVFAPFQPGKPALLISAGEEWGTPLAGAVRLWNAVDGAYLTGVMLPHFVTRPSVAGWQTGPGAKQVQVAIAWGDNLKSLRIWNAESGTLRTAPDGGFNDTLAWWPETARLVTGSTGKLKLWNVSGAGQNGSPVVERELPLPGIPRAITLFSSVPKGPTDRGALMMKSGKAADPIMRLRVVDLKKFQLVDESSITLWNGDHLMPCIAAAPGGAHLAMAGNRAHEIASVAITDLTHDGTSPTMLRGAGFAARNVAFARKQGTLGLFVSPQLGATASAFPASGDLVFDPVQRRVSHDFTGWQLAQPSLGDWRVDSGISETGERTGQYLTVRRGQQVVKQIWIPARHTLNSFSLRPPGPPLQKPILAVATNLFGQPLLTVYDATTGSVVREMSGHVAPIDALAFSEDGKLLVSAAGDRTVCVWNLKNLDAVVGVRGALSGLLFERNAQAVRVASVERDSPYRGGPLSPNDTVFGWVRQGRVEPIDSLTEFYLRISHVAPGETIALRRQRPGQPPQTVQLIVGQGTDEQKPLLTLFIAEDERNNRWNWIGWNPLGPFESNGEGIEQLLGWHFNTGLPRQPTRFSLADEYQTFRRDNLIKHLLSEQALPVDRPLRLPRPPISIRLRQNVPGHEIQVADGHNSLRLVRDDAELDVEIRGLAATQIGQVTWRTGDSQPQRFEPISSEVWTARLSNLGAARGEPTVSLAVTTNEAEPQTFTEELALIYRPAAPVIEQVQPAAEHSIVAESAGTLHAQVRSLDSETAGLLVRVLHTAGKQQVLSRELRGNGTLSIDLPIALRQGDNTISIVAVNSGAGDVEMTSDKTSLVRRVVYNPESVAPPEMKVEAISVDGTARQALTSERAQPLVLDTPVLQLRGRISSQKPLVKAGWFLDDPGRVTPISRFVPNAAAEIELAEQITLEPGSHRLHCMAQTEGSLPAEVSLTVLYQPRLPQLFLTAPAANTELIAGRDARRVKVSGRFERIVDKHPFKITYLLSGRALDVEPLVDRSGEAFSAKLDLAPGENKIAVQLSNQWGATTTSEAVRVQYLRPPQVVEVLAPEKADVPLTDVQFMVESPAELELNGLQINGRMLPAGSAVIEHQGDGTTRWKVTAHDVPLVEGANQLQPLARNRDGWSAIVKSAQVMVMLPPPPTAKIEFVAPLTDRTTASAEFETGFVIHSESRLKKADLYNGTREVCSIDVSRQVEEARSPGQEPGFRLDATADVKLDPSDNCLRVIAVNDGGESESRVTVTYVQKPVELVVDRLQSLHDPLSSVKPELREGGRALFTKEAPDGNVWLHGRVRWPDSATRQANKVSMVQVWVNGFLQPSVPLQTGSPDGIEGTWKAKIRLNRALDNEISVRVPGLALLSDNRLDLKVNCKKPDARQRLHLFVIGVGDEDPQRLEKLALNAMQGKRTTGEQITTPAFEQGWIYPICGYISRGRVSGQLDRIYLRINDRGSDDAGTDVIVVYYHGREIVDQQGQFYLLTSQSQVVNSLESAISGKELADRFSRIPGVQLFLLDVRRDQPARDTLAQWPHDPHMAAMRYAWLKKDETAPTDARLLVALDNAVPLAARLGEIEVAVSRSFQQAREKYGNAFEYEQRIPQGLRELLLIKPTVGNN